MKIKNTTRGKKELKKVIASVFTENGQYKKSNGLINAKGRATLTALRLFAISTKYAEYNTQTHAAVAKVPMTDIKKLLGLKGHSFSSIVDKATFKGDRNSLLDWRIIAEDGAYNVVQDAICKDGMLYVTYNSKLSNQIIGFKNNYTTLNLDESLMIGSTYAFHLYEILKSRLDLLRSKNGRKESVTWKINFTDLKMRLGLINVKDVDLQKQLNLNNSDWKKIEGIVKEKKLGMYNNEYKTIKSRVLNKAVEEVNEKTSLEVSFFENKVGRAVDSIIFIIDDKKKEKLNELQKDVLDGDEENLFAEEITLNDSISIINEKQTEEENNNSKRYETAWQVSELLKNEGLSNSEILKIVDAANCDLDRIKKAYDVTLAQDEVSNFVGFMLSAIKNNYEPPKKRIKKIETFIDKNGIEKMIGVEGFEEHVYDYAELERKLRKN